MSASCPLYPPQISLKFGRARNFVGVSYNGSMYALGACGLGSTPSTPKTKI